MTPLFECTCLVGLYLLMCLLVLNLEITGVTVVSNLASRAITLVVCADAKAGQTKNPSVVGTTLIIPRADQSYSLAPFDRSALENTLRSSTMI